MPDVVDGIINVVFLSIMYGLLLLLYADPNDNQLKSFSICMFFAAFFLFFALGSYTSQHGSGSCIFSILDCKHRLVMTHKLGLLFLSVAFTIALLNVIRLFRE